MDILTLLIAAAEVVDNKIPILPAAAWTAAGVIITAILTYLGTRSSENHKFITSREGSLTAEIERLRNLQWEISNQLRAQIEKLEASQQEAEEYIDALIEQIWSQEPPPPRLRKPAAISSANTRSIEVVRSAADSLEKAADEAKDVI